MDPIPRHDHTFHAMGSNSTSVAAPFISSTRQCKQGSFSASGTHRQCTLKHAPHPICSSVPTSLDRARALTPILTVRMLAPLNMHHAMAHPLRFFARAPQREAAGVSCNEGRHDPARVRGAAAGAWARSRREVVVWCASASWRGRLQRIPGIDGGGAGLAGQRGMYGRGLDGNTVPIRSQLEL